MKKYQFIDHTADIKFKAFGRSMEEVFEHAAEALFVSVYDGPVEKKKTFQIKAEGKDAEALLYNFLEEFLLLIDEKHFLPTRARVKIKNNVLTAEVLGDAAEDYVLHMHVKAITYNDMFVREEKKNAWVAQVVLDI